MTSMFIHVYAHLRLFFSMELGNDQQGNQQMTR